MPLVGISRGGGRERGCGAKASAARCRCGGGGGGEGGILRGLQDAFSDGLHLKRGAFTFCSPLLLKIPTLSPPPVSSVLNPDFTKKDSALPKMLSFSRWITLDKSRMIIMSTLDTDASYFYQCEFR